MLEKEPGLKLGEALISSGEITEAQLSEALCSQKQTGGKLGEIVDFRANARALSDTLQLKYLDGGGHGCNYPDERFSHFRRNIPAW